MKKIASIVALKLKMIMRDKISLIWMFVAPIVFVTVIVYGFSSNSSDDLRIAVVSEKQENSYKEFVKLLEDAKYKPYESTKTNARRDIIEGKIAVAVVIPDDFDKVVRRESKSTVDVLKMQDTVTSIALVRAVERAISTMQLRYATGEAVNDVMETYNLPVEDSVKETVIEKFDSELEKDVITYASSSIEEKDEAYNSISYSTLGILVLFIVFFVVSSADGILQDKLMGTWNRLLTTGVSNFQIFTGNILSIFLLGCIQTTVLIIFSKFVYKVDWGNSILGIVGLFASFLFCITGISLIIGVVVSSKKQLTSVTALVVMPTSLLAGCMWSRDIMSDTLLKIADFMPQSWVIVGVSNLVANGSVTNIVTKSILVLLGFGCLYFVIGLFIFGFQKKAVRN